MSHVEAAIHSPKRPQGGARTRQGRKRKKRAINQRTVRLSTKKRTNKSMVGREVWKPKEGRRFRGPWAGGKTRGFCRAKPSRRHGGRRLNGYKDSGGVAGVKIKDGGRSHRWLNDSRSSGKGHPVTQ